MAKTIFSSPKFPHQLLGPAQPHGQWVKWLVLTHLHQWLRSRMVEIIFSSLYGVVLNYLNTRTIFCSTFHSCMYKVLSESSRTRLKRKCWFNLTQLWLPSPSK
jgi:hypothetical protein